MAANSKSATTKRESTVVDTQAANLELSKKVNALEETRKSVAVTYKNEKKVAVQGSPMYRPYFGNNMPIIINGVAIYVPLADSSTRFLSHSQQCSWIVSQELTSRLECASRWLVCPKTQRVTQARNH